MSLFFCLMIEFPIEVEPLHTAIVPFVPDPVTCAISEVQSKATTSMLSVEIFATMTFSPL
jgi:hypothetical protein